MQIPDPSADIWLFFNYRPIPQGMLFIDGSKTWGLGYPAVDHLPLSILSTAR